MAGLPVEIRVGFDYPNTDFAPPDLSQDHPQILLEMELQQHSEWCWSAAALAVRKLHDPTYAEFNQCSLVSFIVGRPCNCENPDEECNSPCKFSKPLTAVGCFSQFIEGRINFDLIINELNDGNPIGCLISWNENDGHIVVICGAFTDLTGIHHVLFTDPMSPDTIRALPLEEFSTEFRGVGNWGGTWLTQPPKNSPGETVAAVS